MFGNESLPTKVYVYGCNGGPLTNADLCQAELIAAHRYRNKLVEIERRRRQDASAALLQFFPRLAAIDAEASEIEAKLEACRTEIKRGNARRRKRGVSDPAKEATDALKSRLKELRAEAKPLRQAAYTPPEDVQVARKRLSDFKRRTGRRGAVLEQQPGYDEIAAELASAQERWEQANPYARRMREIDESAHAAALNARANRGCYWGTGGQVERAVEQASKDSLKNGSLPEFKRFAGTGKLSAQIQGGMSLEELFSMRDTRVRLEKIPPRVEGGRDELHRVWLRIGSEGREPVWATWEVVVPHDRPLPPECTIKEVHLVARRIATHVKWSLQYVVSQEGGFPRENQSQAGTVAVNFGFRMIDRSLRVAYWVGDDGRHGELFLPLDHLRQFAQVHHLQSIRDKLFDGAKETLACWLEGSEPPPWLWEQIGWLTQEERKTQRPAVRKIVTVELAAYKSLHERWSKPNATTAEAIKDHLRKPPKEGEAQSILALRQWRSQAKLAAAAIRWRASRVEGDAEIFSFVEAWRKRDKHMYEWKENQRCKAINRRKHAYRNFAAELSQKYRLALLDNTDYRKIARQPSPEHEDELTKNARANRTLASASNLRESLAAVMAATMPRDVVNMTITCHACGGEADVTEGETGLRICPHCNLQWDRDYNLCRNLLADFERSRGEETPATAR